MEVFRRLGVAAHIRDAGLPADYPHDVSYRTTFTGTELTRIPIPSRNGRRTGETGPDTWWPTAEPPHRINQIFLEPILYEHAIGFDRIRILNRTSTDSLEQHADGVVASVRDLNTDETYTISCKYMIGCDGGKSMVRKAIGAKLTGDAVVQRVQSTYIDAPDLINLMEAKPAWATFSLNPRRTGNVYAIDGRRTWLIHNYLRDEEPDFESVDRDWAIRAILGVDENFKYTILNKEDWFGRRLVADKFRDRRVFICGDASHIWVPYAGYGMNAGIADAANLAWLLAAHLQGWAPESILEAHERERQPITEQVSRFAMNHAHEMASQRRSVPANIEEDTPEGAEARVKLGKVAYDLNVQQYACGGLNFGYYYDDSPIVAYDGEKAPAYSMFDFKESTVPGCRTPHFWLEDGRSLYDALGQGYTLLRFDPTIDVSSLVAAAATRRVPLEVLDVGVNQKSEAYTHSLVLVRPDQHVAWRGNEQPQEAIELVDLIRGASPKIQRNAA
jgi:2-polyprenyl-6-methoxyphenol hydroxylase-like FAD-dependent oxidoreductase